MLNQSSVQDYQINLKEYNKLQRKYLAEAIVDTQWTAMSPSNGFYLNRDDGTIKVKIPQSQTVSNVNPNNFEKQNLEIVGKSANLRIENMMDSMCQRVASVQFIQKFYRGHLVRKAMLQHKQRLIKA